MDEPTTAGGTDTGPKPTELLLASLGACFALAVAHVVRKRGQELPDVRVRVRGEYRGAGFDRITVEASSSEPELVRSVLEQAIRSCYVSNTIRGAPEIEYRVAPAVPSHGGQPPPPRR
ncbi:MAG TPA: OsmC family protein [Actinomycetes bacterium]